MSYQVQLAEETAVSFPYAWVGGKGAIKVSLQIELSGQQPSSNTQTVTFDDPLPEEPASLVVFTNDSTGVATIRVDTLNEKDLDSVEKRITPQLVVVLFKSTRKVRGKRPTVLVLSVCKEA